MAAPIPEVVVMRLPVYTRALAQLAAEGQEVVSSQELGQLLRVTPAQIRKDLSYFGRFGRQGRGYNIRRLMAELQHILGIDRSWTMALVGVGHLGEAILNYRGFAPQGFNIIAAFDTDPQRIGKKMGGITVQRLEEVRETIAARKIDIGIVAVPAAETQKVIDLLVVAGIKAILNYAPSAAQVPAGVKKRDIDPVLALQSMTFYLKEAPK